MRDQAGGSYPRALANTFLPEFLSMNVLMAGMIPIASLGRIAVGGMASPLTPEFWFVLSMALLFGFAVAFPMNWWLIAKGLKQGMMTVRRPSTARGMHEPSDALPNLVRPVSADGHAVHANASRSEIVWMAILSVTLFVLGIGAADLLSGR